LKKAVGAGYRCRNLSGPVPVAGKRGFAEWMEARMNRFRFHGVLLLVSVLAATASAAPGAPSGAQSATDTTKVELGRLLFWDPILSGEKDIACATCHHPDFAYADGREISLGAGAVGLGPERVDASDGRIPVMRRNAPTILNTAFNGLDRRRRRRSSDDGPAFDGTPASVDQARAPMFWDSRVRSLEAQALEPIKATEEMRGNAYPEAAAVETVVARLQTIPEYVALFEEVYGPGPITADRLAATIAAFERSLVATSSPFDRFRAGDADALTAQQRRGMEAFEDADCDRCHEGIMFSDFDLRAEGVREHPLVNEPDAGGGRFRFRTPSLRNVALTAPYMHNGVLATLEDVLRFYDEGRSQNPNVADRGRRGEDRRTPRVDSRFRGVDDLSESEMQDIIAFLQALTDENFDRVIPERVPSGLPVGGLIGPGTASRE
jgi:cytochrome c peroxidase